MTHAAARAGILPGCLSCWSNERGTPRAALFFSVALACAYVICFNTTQLAYLSNVQYVARWLLRCIVTFILLYVRCGRYEVPAVRLHINILFICLYLVFLVAMVASHIAASWSTVLFTFFVLIASQFVYFTLISKRGCLRKVAAYERFYSHLASKQALI